MSRIEREKNLLKIFVNDTDIRPIVFDVNSGILYGKSGMVVKSTPNGLHSVCENSRRYENANLILSFIYYMHTNEGIAYTDMTNYAEYFKIVDKIQSANAKFLYSYSWKEDLLLINNNFKEYVKFCNDNTEMNIYDITYRFKNYIVMKNFNKVFYLDNYHLAEDEKQFIVDYATNENLVEDTKKISLICNWVQKGLFTFCGGYQATRNKIKEYFNWASMLGTEYEKGDFMRLWIDAKRKYEFAKEEFDNLALRKNQLSVAEKLSFENDELIVVIPTTTKEFEMEGNSQHNCVARMYLPRVIENSTHIVFIRKKNDLENSYITCEVDMRGNIVQFLARYNNRNLEDIATKFKEDYAKHLRECFA